MMNDIEEQLEKSIRLLTYKLKNFDEEKLTTDEGNEEYNKLLLKKVIMAQKLKYMRHKPNISLFDKLKRKLRGQKLICDSF